MRNTKKARRPTEARNKNTTTSNVVPLTGLACLAALSTFVAATPFDSLVRSARVAAPAIEPVDAQFVSLSEELPAPGVH